MSEELMKKMSRLMMFYSFLFIFILLIFYLILFISPFLIFYGILIFGPILVLLGRFLEGREKVEKRMIYCTNCGLKLPRDFNFCPTCFSDFNLVTLRRLWSRNL